MYFQFQFQNKIAVFRIGAEEGVGCLGYASAYNLSFFDRIKGLTAQLMPAFEAFAVEKFGPLGGESKGKQQEQEYCGVEFVHGCNVR